LWRTSTFYKLNSYLFTSSLEVLPALSRVLALSSTGFPLYSPPPSTRRYTFPAFFKPVFQHRSCDLHAISPPFAFDNKRYPPFLEVVTVFFARPTDLQIVFSRKEVVQYTCSCSHSWKCVMSLYKIFQDLIFFFSAYRFWDPPQSVPSRQVRLAASRRVRPCLPILSLSPPLPSGVV